MVYHLARNIGPVITDRCFQRIVNLLTIKGDGKEMVITSDCVEPPDFRELVVAAKRGDAEAFCSLVEPLQDRLFRQAMILCHDASQAEDLVAETLVQAWKSLVRYDESCRLSTWLYAILIHRHLKSVRRAKSRPISLSWLPWMEVDGLSAKHENLSTADPTPSDAAVQDELAREWRKIIDALPKKLRQVVLLRFFEDASLADMAAVLGCPLGTVKSRLHHALEHLRKMKVNLSELRRDA